MRQLHDTYRALEGGGSEGGRPEPGLRVKEAERRGGREVEEILEERKQGGGNFHLLYVFIFLERLIIFND